MFERLVPLGEIVTTHGIDGWLKLKLYNPLTSVLTAPREITLGKGGVSSTRELELTRPHKGHLLMKLRDIDRIDDAEPWVGYLVSVSEAALEPLEPGEFYHYQVVGLDVFDLKGERIGVVTRIWSKPGGVLYVVAGDSKEYLIPAVKELIEKVDLAEGKILINLPDGLLDL